MGGVTAPLAFERWPSTCVLRERPRGQGLAVPAMVPGSPGMSGIPVAYETLLFERSGSFKVFQRH